MQTSRQKKRASQLRKKKHANLKTEGSVAKTSSPSAKHSKEQNPQAVKECTIARPKNHGSEDTKREEQLGGNWEEPTLDDNLTDSITYYQENQEQLQQQLVQLLNLPIHHTPPPPAEPSISLTKPEIEESFLTLDCTALANSLSCLPMHKRLDISLELLDLCEQAPLLDSTGTVDQLCPPLEKVDLSTCTRKKDYSFKVSSSLPSVSTDQHQETSQIEDFITDDRSVFKKTPIVPVTKQVLEKCEVDEELDKLLESSLMVSQEDKVDTVVVREPPKVLTDRVDHDGGDTAELNDILDELLS